uniref:Uncharacterized protein n=1 Tax=Oryza brachyantha TaxID=4533 RepID=J3N3F4_ORYBR
METWTAPKRQPVVVGESRGRRMDARRRKVRDKPHYHWDRKIEERDNSSSHMQPVDYRRTRCLEIRCVMFFGENFWQLNRALASLSMPWRIKSIRCFHRGSKSFIGVSEGLSLCRPHDRSAPAPAFTVPRRCSS